MRVALAAVLAMIFSLVGSGPLALSQADSVAALSPSVLALQLQSSPQSLSVAGMVSGASATYVVRGGDCLYSIAQQFGTTVAAIVQANGLVTPDLIYPGQRLIIPLASQSREAAAEAPVEADVAASAAPASEPAAPSAPSPAAVANPMTPRETAMFDALNERRVAAGLPALRFDPALLPIARARSGDMATRNYFSHTTPEGGTVQDLVYAAGLSYTWVNEILARNNYPEDQTLGVAVNAFMNSPAHRAHVLHPVYYRAAVGEARSTTGMKYYTVMLASDD